VTPSLAPSTIPGANGAGALSPASRCSFVRHSQTPRTVRIFATIGERMRQTP
jgi:hypothetical protein